MQNAHLHYLGWRRARLERALASLRLDVAAASGLRAERLYAQINATVARLNLYRAELGLTPICAYA